MSDKARARLAAVLVLAVLVALGAWLVKAVGMETFLDQEKLTALLERAGALAPLTFFAMQFLQVILAPIPGNVIALAGGAIFGLLWGSVISCSAIFLGSVMMFALGRRYGKKLVLRLVEPEVYAKYAPRLSGKGARNVLIGIFLLPMFPDDMICLLAGITDIPARSFLWLVAVGRMPSIVVNILLGSSLHSEYRNLIFILVGIYYAAVFLIYHYVENIKNRAVAVKDRARDSAAGLVAKAKVAKARYRSGGVPSPKGQTKESRKSRMKRDKHDKRDKRDKRNRRKKRDAMPLAKSRRNASSGKDKPVLGDGRAGEADEAKPSARDLGEGI